MTRKKWATLVVIVVLAVVGILAWFMWMPTRHFRIAFNTWIGYGPFYIAKEKGFFDAEGIKVELERIEGTGERRAALIAKRIEALGSTIDDLVVGASQGVPAKMVLGIDESAGADGIVAVNTIKSVKELKGKTIAVQPGFVNHFFLLYLLDRVGLSPNDVKIEAMEPDTAGLAFVAGKIDVAVTWEPHLSKAKQRKDGHVLITSADPMAKGVIVDILMVRSDVIQTRRREVEGVIRAWFKAIEYWKKSPDESNAIIAKALNLKTPEVAEMLSGVRLFDEAINRDYLTLSGNPGTVLEVANKAAELYHAQKLITAKPNPREIVDISFVTK